MYVCVWTDSSIEGQGAVDHHIYKLGPRSPTHSRHELYRSIQKGGNIPEHGLQLSTASDRKGDLSFYNVYNVNRQYSNMGAVLSFYRATPC